MRVLLASAMLLAPITPASVSPTLFLAPDAIVQVVCFGKNEISSGTAFRVGPRLMGDSVNHVTSSGACFIAGKPITLAYKSPDADFSELLADDGPYLGIDCGGFVKGRKYLALGFARGGSDVSVEMEATGETDSNGNAMLSGMVPVIPGQSGGPVIDETTGRVVGTVNMENFEAGLSWSVPLSATPICRKDSA